MTEQKTELSDAEVEELISSDATPEVGRKQYTHSKQYFQKQLLQKQKEERAKERLGLSETKDRVAQYRSEHVALFESVPQIVAISIEEMVSSARLFARLLRQDDSRQGIDFRIDYIPPAETARQFCTRIFHRWATGVTITGLLGKSVYRFPLVNLGQENGDRTEAFFALFDWLPEGKVLSGEPELPTTWPEGSDTPLTESRII